MQNKDTAMLGTSGYERVEHDLYETPPWCTEVLLRHVVFKKDILEPAAGRGAIAKVLEANGYRTTCNDIVDWGLSDCRIVDFLTTKCTPAACDIVTNPPYNLAEEFVRHALRITKRGEKVAMLLRNEWDCAFNRADLFTDEPFKLKIVGRCGLPGLQDLPGITMRGMSGTTIGMIHLKLGMIAERPESGVRHDRVQIIADHCYFVFDLINFHIPKAIIERKRNKVWFFVNLVQFVGLFHRPQWYVAVITNIKILFNKDYIKPCFEVTVSVQGITHIERVFHFQCRRNPLLGNNISC
jgi:hypothetical protein